MGNLISSRPRPDAPYLFLLDYPTDEADAYNDILRGPTMKVLTSSIEKAGISLNDCAFHTLFPRVGHNSTWPTYFDAKSIPRPAFSHCIPALTNLLQKYPPKIIIPLGAFSLWAIGGSTKIRTYRGYLARSPKYSHWYLPSYSPHTIVKDYSLRAFLIHDLQKARQYLEEGLSPTRKFRNRSIFILDTIEEVERGLAYLSAFDIAIDIETFMDIQQISTISFSPDPLSAYVLPLLQQGKPDLSYWSPEEEQRVWIALFDLLTEKTHKKRIFHNGLFDITHIWNAGIPTRGQIEDTMILAHSLQPELPKSLAVLGSILCDMPAWKSMRVRTKDTEKVED